jgi:hypothetical protein
MKTILSFLLAIIATVRSFFNKRHHLITVPVAVLLFAGIVPILRWFDPTAAAFDAGIFQIPIFAAVQFFIYLAIAWYTFRFVFGNFYRHLIIDMKNDFKNITSWQKLILSYSIFFLLFAALVLLAVKIS